MSTTFTNNDEVKDINYAFCNAQLVQSAAQMPVAPPPFNLVGLPTRLLVGGLRRCIPYLKAAMAKCRERAGTRVFTALQEDVNAGADATPTPVAPPSLSRERVFQYVIAHLAEADSENRWRSKLMNEVRGIDGSVRELSGRVNQVVACLGALQPARQRLPPARRRRRCHGVRRNHRPASSPDSMCS